jgi:hypothetical protein
VSATRLNTDEQQSLADAVRAEHAAVYAYGLVAAYAADENSAAVNAAGAAHRSRRDATMRLLRTDGVEPPQAEAGYVIPVPVTNPETAAKLAAEVENETALAWRSVLERTTPTGDGSSTDLRATAVTALTDCAVRMATWRAALGESPPTTPFPGKP